MTWLANYGRPLGEDSEEDEDFAAGSGDDSGGEPTDDSASGSDSEVGRCGCEVSKPVLKGPMLLALDTTIS
jgi:hypothetical protein